MLEDTTKQITDVPDEVYDFIDDPKQLQLVDEIITKYGLGGTDNVFGIIDPIPNLVVAGKLHPAEIADRVEAGLNLTSEKAHEMALDIVRLLLLPVRKHLPEVDRFAIKWEMGDVEQPKKETQKVSANEFVRGEVEKYKLQMPTPVLQSRFEKTLSQYLAKAKTKEETVNVLTRDRQIGGLELDPMATEKLLAGIVDDAKHVAPKTPTSGPTSKPSFAEASTFAKATVDRTEGMPIPLPPRKKVNPIEELKPKKVFDAVTIRPADEKEVKEHEEKIPKIEPVLNVDDAVSLAVKNVKASAAMDQETLKRLKVAVGTRMRGVRDAYALRSVLEADSLLGGLGLKGADLAQALIAVEEVFGKFDKKLAQAVEEEKKEFVAKRVERFEKKTSVEPVSNVVPQGSNDVELEQEPKLIKRNPRMQDVTAPRKLFGPIEELAEMTIESFRRLGGSADVSAEEIIERVKLLEGESYGRRLNGISAWRRSPLYATYVSLVSESMRDGKPISSVLADHKSAGENTFTSDEIRALLKLNKVLRV